MAGKIRLACLALVALITPLHAEDTRWVDAKVSAVKIAAKPGAGAYENRPQPVSIPTVRQSKITILPDGRRMATIGKSPYTLSIVFSQAAWDYMPVR